MRVRTRRILLVVVGLLLSLLVAAITAVGWQVVFGPRMRPLTARHFEASPVRLARGKYLVEGVSSCFHCHSDHDWSTPQYLTPESKKGSGWTMPIPELGTLVAPNITPDRETGIGTWTDDEIARAIQEGVSKNGRALFPVMPWMNFRQMSEEDLASTVVYLRSIPAVRNVLPKSTLIFPLNLIVNTMPQPLTAPVPSKARTTPVERGEYLVTLANCRDCHSAMDERGQAIPGLDLAGGNVFHDPVDAAKSVFSVNITPDPSGISHYDEALFIKTLRTGALPGRMLNHTMPFEYLRNLTDEDLGAMFAYLQSVPKAQHRITNTDTPSLCPLCKQRHGLGELNVKR